LGIDGGATRTVALLTDHEHNLVRRCEAGPGNVRLLDDRELVDLLSSLRIPTHSLAAVVLGMAGARTEADRERIRAAAARVWPGVRCRATNDLETALAAARTSNRASAQEVLVLSGTGACCFGRSTGGHSVKVGGWGHLLGDRGSGYDIGRRALETVLARFDDAGRWPPLGRRLLRKLTLNEPEDFIDWVQGAAKSEVAALAVEVFAAAHDGDRMAQQIVREAAGALAVTALACARRLQSGTRPVCFVLAGGTLLHQPNYARAVSRQLKRGCPRSKVVRLEREGAWGAVDLALDLAATAPPRADQGVVAAEMDAIPAAQPGAGPVASQDLARSPTEQRNPRSAKLDRMSLRSAIELFLSEEARVPAALREEAGLIEKACHLIVGALRQGGRLFYVGAGTSGRLGVLDASECPPTFGTRPDQVQGIIAGGARALCESVEGAEDDREGGARAVRYRGVGAEDVVVGVAASGRTPFVWGALTEARARGAKTVLVCFDPALRELGRGQRPDVVIAAGVGPELLTGSTRLKAGTATKLILNLFTTLAMVRLGKTMSNLMVDLNPANAKLRDRAVRVVSELTGRDAATARQALSRTGWSIRKAVRRCRAQPGSGGVSAR
jgi:N-acetylmuramic acid 6-phosphate etherase